MSKTIDERVVEMKFDNAQFEKNVEQSMSTIEKLKHALNFDSACKSFDELEKAANDVDMSNVYSAVQSVTSKFNSLEVIARAALTNITNSAVNTGKQLLASLSVDNISAGWTKFGEKTQSVGTLISQGYDLETVTEQLERLNWFTDETSYNFTDMVANIAKFTATGQDLETSVTALEGIANWAALSGQNASTASHAMYQLSQAMGAGVMRKEDYKSIQNVSMDTDEFRQKCLDAGVALGTLQKTGENTYKSLIACGEDFTKSQFAEHLTEDAWLTSEVMMKVFNEYSAAVSQLYEYTEENGGTASEAIEVLGSSVDEFGLKAFKAAQEARTWGDAVDSVKDAVSTGWMNTFEIIFGNYEEAKGLWTDLANAMYDAFASGAEARNELLKGWKELGGRTKLVEAFWAAWNKVGQVLNTIKKAYRNVFPAMSSDRLYSVTKGLNDFVASIKLSDTVLDKLERTFEGFFSIVDIVATLFGGALKTGVRAIIALLKGLNIDVLGLTSSVGDTVVSFHDWLLENEEVNEVLSKFSDGVVNCCGSIGEWIRAFADLITSSNAFVTVTTFINDGVSSLIENLSGVTAIFKEWLSSLTTMDSITLGNIGSVVKSLKEKVASYFSGIDEGLSDVRASAGEFQNSFSSSLKTAEASASSFGASIAKVVSYVGSKISAHMGEILTIGIGGGLIYTINSVSKTLGKFAKPVTTVTDIMGSFNGVLSSTKKAIDAFTKSKNSKVEAIRSIAVSIAILAASVAVLACLDSKKLANAVTAILVLGSGLLLASAAMGQLGKLGGSGMQGSASILAIAASMVVLAGALKVMDTLDENKLGTNAAVLGFLIAELALVSGLLSKYAPKMSSGVIGLLAFAAAIKLIVSVLKDLEGVENVKDSAPILIGIIAGLYAASFAMKGLSWSAGVGALAFVLALSNFIKLLKQIANGEELDAIKKNIDKIIVVLGLFAAMLLVSNFAGKNASKAGISILAMSAGLLLITVAIKMMSGINNGDLQRATNAVTQILVIFGLITALSKFAGNNAVKAGAMILLMSGAMIILAASIVVLSHIDPNGLANAVAAISVLMIVFAGVIAASYLAKECKTTLTMIAVTIGILAVSLGALSLIEPDRLESASNAMVKVMALFALVVASTSLVKSSTGTIIAIGVVITILAASLYLLQDLSPESAITVVGSLTTLLLALTVSFKIMSSIGSISAGAYVAMGAMLLVLALLAGLLVTMASYDVAPSLETAAALSILLVALAASCAIMGQFGVNGPAAYNGVGVMITLITAVGTLMAAVGALTEYFPDLEKFLSKGISILEQIGAGIGGFFGNIVAGFVEGVMGSAPTIAEDLSTFMEKLQPFLTGASAITTTDFDGFNTFVDTLGNLSDALVKWRNNSSYISEFASGLSEFGSQLTSYASSVSTLTDDGVAGIKRSAEAAGYLVDLAKSFPNSGGALGVILGNNGFTEFTKGLSDFGKELKKYANSVSGMTDADVESIKSSAEAGKALADFAYSIPNSGGVLGFFAGNNDLDDFATGVSKFGEALASYCTAVSGITNIDEVIASITVAQYLVDLTNNLSNSGGAISFLVGDNTLSRFGTELEKFAPKIKSYCDSVAGIDVSGTYKVKSIIQDLVNIVNGMDNSGGIISLLSGDNTLSRFGDELVYFGKQFIKFCEDMANVDTTQLGSAISMALGTVAIDNIVLAFTESGEKIDNAVNVLTTYIVTSFSMRYEQFKQIGTEIIDYLITGVSIKEVDVWLAFSEMLDYCQITIRASYIDFYNTGIYLVEGFAAGIDEYTWYAEAKAKAMAKAADEAARRELGIASPSKVAYEIGGYFGQGFVNALSDYESTSYNAGTSLAASAKSGLQTAVSKISDFIENGIDSQPTIRPVLDLSEVQSQAGQLSAMFSRNQAMSISSGIQQAAVAGIQNGSSGSAGNSVTINAQFSGYAEMDAKKLIRLVNRELGRVT